ncbi:MAG: hypothetical protein Fur0021_10980 [Candidatus Promineifilaceae bacterium]
MIKHQSAPHPRHQRPILSPSPISYHTCVNPRVISVISVLSLTKSHQDTRCVADTLAEIV